MAYVPATEEDKNKQGAQQPNLASQVVPTSSAPGAGPGVGKGTSSANANQTPGQPFTNINAYLTANAPQIAQQGETVAKGLTDQYGQLKSGIEKGAQDFNTQVQSGYTAPNADVVNAATANPTEFANNPENVKAFQSQFNYDYNGPQSFETTDAYGKLSGDVAKGVENANLVNTIPGLQTYLRNTGPATATQGENILDTVLLQGNPEAYSKVTEAAKPFNTLTDYLGTNVNASNKVAQDLMAKDQAQAEAVQGQFVGDKGILPTFQKDFDTRLQAAQAKGTDFSNTSNKLLDYLSGKGTLTPEEFTKLGLSPDLFTNNLKEGEFLKRDYGITPDYSSYANIEAPNISRETFANPQDYAEAMALAKLTGQDLSSFLNPQSASQAGTSSTGKVNFDLGNAWKDVSGQLQQQDNAFLGQASNIINSAISPSGMAYFLNDPQQGPNYRKIGEALSRNETTLNENGKNWLNTYRQATGQTPSDSRLQIQNGQFMWKDQGGQWVPAPTEFKNEGGVSYKFNYNTGQYEAQGPADTGGTVGPTFHAS